MLTKEEKEKIKNAIMHVEKKTTGEVVPVLATASSPYFYIHLKSAIVCSLIVAISLFYFLPEERLSRALFLEVQAFSLILGYLLAYIPFVKRLLLPRKAIQYKTLKRATWEFFEHNLHETQERTGVLVFVSLFERKIHILADKGINSKVDQGTWDKFVSEFVSKVKEHRLCEAYCEIIEKVGEVLAANFPNGIHNDDELKNDIIIKNARGEKI